MHKEVLSKEQIELLTFVKQFQKEFYLVGGTAIALQIGHRRSIDFIFLNLNQSDQKHSFLKLKTWVFLLLSHEGFQNN